MVRAGAEGLIVDGAVRDVDGLHELGIPTFARGVHPATGSKDGPGALNVPIQCGAVAVEPGDIIRGDASGLVVIPQRQAEKVLDLCRRVAENESRWKAGLADGIPLSAQLDLDNQIKRAGHGDQPVP
jgi:4-hydroxy-4-methyl-2-oxoglutarate aldolase